MNNKRLDEIIRLISKGDTSAAETLFSKPAGRKYLENIVLVLVCNLPYLQEEKEELFISFRRVLDKIERRIERQKEGQQILDQIID